VTRSETASIPSRSSRSFARLIEVLSRREMLAFDCPRTVPAYLVRKTGALVAFLPLDEVALTPQLPLRGGAASELPATSISDDEEGVRLGTPALQVELAELAEGLGLIGIGQPGGGVSPPFATWGSGMGVTSSTVTSMTGTALGRDLARLGNLEDVVQVSELENLTANLSTPLES